MENGFLGFLPDWIGDLLSVLGLPAVILAFIVWLLGRRDANRRLTVDEGTLKKSEFDSFTEAQREQLKISQQEAKDAKAEADDNADRVDTLEDLYDNMRDVIHRLRNLFRKVVAKTGYTMTAEEIAEFEATKPLPRPPRARK